MTIAQVLQDEKLKHFVCPEKVPVTRLELDEAWNALDEQQKLYAHYFSRAAISGTGIVLGQCSEESPLIYKLLVLLCDDLALLKEKTLNAGVSEKDYDSFLQYSVQFFGNLGNYVSFGDSKFVPRLEVSEFEKIVNCVNNEQAVTLFQQVKEPLYSLDTNLLELSFGNSSYYNREVTSHDAERVKSFMESNSIAAENTRLFKTGENQFELKIASASPKASTTHTHEDLTITTTYGDFSKELAGVRDNLERALPYSANEFQKNMLIKYRQHFDGGDFKDFCDSQIQWVQDKGPIIETNIGFIETYRDVLRVRAEFEGFVAVVNRIASMKAQAVVEDAEKFISRLPWNTDKTNGDKKPFEVETFTKPDFTSLEVLTFTSSGLPAGINIPNQFFIRESHGFKNVSLGNVLNAPTAQGEEITFLNEEDKKIFKDYKGKAFEIQVLIHELLGHGSGKLMKENDIKGIIHPITKQPITTFYKEGETFNSVIGEISNAFEECRAECTGIYLCLDREILKICGVEGEEANKIIYANWLLMVRSGLLALQFYNPDTKTWNQAHMMARYSILRVLMEAGLVKISKLEDDLQIVFDGSKIETAGKEAIGNYLLHINVSKATADKADATQLFGKYTAVNEEFVEMRKIVLNKKQPRRVFAQPHTVINKDGKVELLNFPATSEGMINAFVAQAKLNQ
ncbi:dipeptidylpeptidase [Naegleria gruberi]|uniref:Dipeptidyl peptidase 3 n=1 Tax=Naegleria gruberi TaxID=5762 RepID=D2V6I2_NAEGR|nr:dipeptidylpeptidase [Naegleria gruberi]EFC47450.1 dipeptidylpeptidase [Naegleria gruberi]|eukprot:XP_002680194.1 dipeptidylpeptidase [Naegleria gruberi strain NEG-M]